MKCTRCPNEGTHTEWMYRGKWQPIRRDAFPDIPCALCDDCFALWEKYSAIEESLLADGMSRDAVNDILKRMLRAESTA